MPYQWIPPELFLQHHGVAVYRCYDDGGEVSRYWYTTDPTDDNYDWAPADTVQFDVRDLPDGGLDANDQQNHAAIIRQAIEAGLISGEPAAKSEQLSLSQILVQAVETLFAQPSIANVFTNTDLDEAELGNFVYERKKKLCLALIETARLEMVRFLMDLNEKKGRGLGPLPDLPAQTETGLTLSSSVQRADGSQRVKIEISGGVATIVEQPPGVEVEIIDRDVNE